MAQMRRQQQIGRQRARFTAHDSRLAARGTFYRRRVQPGHWRCTCRSSWSLAREADDSSGEKSPRRLSAAGADYDGPCSSSSAKPDACRWLLCASGKSKCLAFSAEQKKTAVQLAPKPAHLQHTAKRRARGEARRPRGRPGCREGEVGPRTGRLGSCKEFEVQERLRLRRGGLRRRRRQRRLRRRGGAHLTCRLGMAAWRIRSVVACALVAVFCRRVVSLCRALRSQEVGGKEKVVRQAFSSHFSLFYCGFSGDDD